MRRLNVACGLAMAVMLGTAPAHAEDAPTLAVGPTSDPNEAADPVRWSVAGSIGPIVLFSAGLGTWPPAYLSGSGSSPVTAWQVQVLRRRDDRHIVFGGALEGTYGGMDNVGPQLLGAHGFAGGEWRYEFLALQATLGAGLEAAEVDVPYSLPTGANGFVTGYYETYHLRVYGQGALAAALSVSDSVDVLLQFAVHFSVSGGEPWFGAGLIGLRYTLP